MPRWKLRKIRVTGLDKQHTKTMYTIRHFTSFKEIPASYDALIDANTRVDLFSDPEWFAILMRNIFADKGVFRVYGVEEASGGRPLLLAPLLYGTKDRAASHAREFSSISHPENYTEIAFTFDPTVKEPGQVLTALFHHLKKGRAEHEQPCDVIRLWPMEENSTLLKTVHAALRAAGFWVQAYANSYNRFETTEGVDYETYFARRSANLRYSVRRRQRALEKAGRLELNLYSDLAGLESAMPDYFTVSMDSWKSMATMIGIDILDLMQLAAAKGCLRLGILRLDGEPAATQFWIVTNGVAHCSRLAYREKYKHLTAGVVLTNFMIAQFLDQDHVLKIDFGYGNDDYKGGWMKEVRNYFGLMAFNPATRTGCYQGARHILGQRLKRTVRGLLRRK